MAPWGPLGFFSQKSWMRPKENIQLLTGSCWLVYPGPGILDMHMHEGRQFIVYTDHKPLTYSLSRTSDPWSARQARQLSYLAEHTADICHIAGEDI
jgi:hypothetical protein